LKRPHNASTSPKHPFRILIPGHALDFRRQLFKPEAVFSEHAPELKPGVLGEVILKTSL